MFQTDSERADHLRTNKMTNSAAIAATDSTSVLENHFEFNARNKSRNVNNAWFYAAIFGLAGGAATMICGLIVSFTVWISGQYLNESRAGVFSTALLVISFALFFLGGYCLDKAYDSFYRRVPQEKENAEKEFNKNTNS